MLQEMVYEQVEGRLKSGGLPPLCTSRATTARCGEEKGLEEATWAMAEQTMEVVDEVASK